MAKQHNHVQVICKYPQKVKRKLVTPKFLKIRPIGDGMDAEQGIPKELQDDEDSFKNAVKFMFLLGQILCLIPVMDKFDWDSYKIYANFAVISCQLVIALLSAVWMYKEFAIFKIGYVLFFFGAGVMMVLMIRLMYMWPKLLKKWQEIEYIFGYQKHLKITFTFISIIIVSFSIIEYLSNLIVSLVTTSQHTSKVLKNYSIIMFPQVFSVVGYSMWRALPIIYVNTVSTLIYTFGDLIVFTISLALSNYFKIYNAQVFELKDKNLSLSEWKKLRYKYMKLCELVYTVDDCLCHLLCLTFLMHLYILCVEINQGMLYITDTNEKIHKIVTFTISMLRACALCYSTVSVHEQSKHISRVIHSTPTSSYCFESELLMIQVMKGDVVLTGSHMFSMKKGFLLTIVSTVISYEVLLLQMRDFSHANLPGECVYTDLVNFKLHAHSMATPALSGSCISNPFDELVP